jgi:hypothetical protein
VPFTLSQPLISPPKEITQSKEAYFLSKTSYIQWFDLDFTSASSHYVEVERIAH